MSVFKKLGLWSNSSDAAAKRFEVKVDEIDDEQPCNPFTEVQILQQHSDIVRQLLVVDEKRIVSVGEDNLAVVWDFQLCTKLCVLSGHTRPITCLLLMAPREDYSIWLLTGSSDKTLRVWDLEQGKCLQVISDHNASVKCLLSISDDIFISGGMSLHLWSGDGKLLSAFERTDEEDVGVMIHVPGHKDRIVSASGKQMSVYQIDVTQNESFLNEATREITFVKKMEQQTEEVRQLVIVCESLFASASLDGKITIWSSKTFSPSCHLNIVECYKGDSHHYPYSIQHVICEEGRYLVTAIGSGFAIFDVISRKLLCQKIKAHYSKVLHLTFVCDGSLLATCSEDGNIRLWGHASQTNNHGTEEKEDMVLKPIERFFDTSYNQLLQCQGLLPEPVLLGECQAHSGAVQMVVDLGLDGMMSCGVDGLVIAWKNSELQLINRNQLLQDQFLNPRGIV